MPVDNWVEVPLVVWYKLQRDIDNLTPMTSVVVVVVGQVLAVVA